MKEIYKIVKCESDVKASEKELRGFQILYEKAFPIDDEKEDFDGILKRIENNDTPNVTLKTYAVLVVDVDGGRVLGGMIADYNPYSDTFLLTYGVVDESLRGQGIGSRMLERGTRKIVSLELGKRKPFATFLEVEDPRLCRSEESYQAALKRLRFMERHGMEVVPIDYRMPPLSKDKDGLNTLRLLRYPKYSKEKMGEIDGDYLSVYLNNFYVELSDNFKNSSKRTYEAGIALGIMEGQIMSLERKDGMVKTVPVSDFLKKIHVD